MRDSSTFSAQTGSCLSALIHRARILATQATVVTLLAALFPPGAQAESWVDMFKGMARDMIEEGTRAIREGNDRSDQNRRQQQPYEQQPHQPYQQPQQQYQYQQPAQQTAQRSSQYSRAQIQNIQTRLQMLGYNLGPADGLFGNKTAEAIAQFEIDQGLPVTGKPSNQVIGALLSAFVNVSQRSVGGAYSQTVFNPGHSSSSPSPDQLNDNQPAPRQQRYMNTAQVTPNTDRSGGKQFAVDARGQVISSSQVMMIGSRVAGYAGMLSTCHSSEHYRSQYLEQVQRLYPTQLTAASVSYDRSFWMGAKRMPQCIEKMATQLEQDINNRLDKLRNAQLMTREAIVASRQGQSRPGQVTEPSDIRGESEEVYQFGTGLAALEAGTTWFRKYYRNYLDTADGEFWRTVGLFKQRRPTDIETAKRSLLDLVRNASNPEEVDQIMDRYLGTRGDRNRREALSIFATADTQRRALAKQAEFEQIRQRNQGGRKLGEIGELELMEATVNSRVRALRLQRKLSEHSVSMQTPLIPSLAMYVTTVQSATPKRCAKTEPHTYICVYSMTITNEVTPEFKKASKGNPLVSAFNEVMGTQQATDIQDVFAHDSQGWYSPSMVRRYQAGVLEMSQSLDEQAEEYREQTQFLDWIVD